jgi:fructose/tagatose bisphosphate aldolase
VPLVPFQELMADAERKHYAVGYFECWDLASLLAVADAADALRSPVLLGFSGISLPHPERLAPEPLAVVAAMGREVGRALSVPCALVFNESPDIGWVIEAIALGFQLVMYSNDALPGDELESRIREVVARAHAQGVAVEGEPEPLEGVSGDGPAEHAPIHLTTPEQARRFLESTGVDALAVNVGQAHWHGRRTVGLDLERLEAIRRAVRVPLVLHGATSVDRASLRAAAAASVRKVNIGSALKQAFFRALTAACAARRDHPNPYVIIGSGLADDVMMAGRLAMRAVVEDYMRVLGSAGRAGGKA